MWPFSNTIPKFERKDWPHWQDLDKDGEDTRQEILKRDSLATTSIGDNGLISKGLWACPYTGRVIRAAKRIDVDHVIALGEAHRMGGFAWSKQQRADFANDPENLLCSYLSANRAKSDLDSFEGMPSNIAIWARYLIIRKKIVEKYGLIQSPAELRAIKFYRAKWTTHKNWIKMGKVRRFLAQWMPGMF